MLIGRLCSRLPIVAASGKMRDMFPVKKRLKLWGFDISIESPKGSIRRWYDPAGKELGHTLMKYDYGYLRGTHGTDGDHVDCYIGPNTDSQVVYIIDQMKKVHGSKKGDGLKWDRFDEQKCMMGWDSAEEAKAAYMKQYDDPRFFGSMKEMRMDEFREKVLDKTNHGKKVATDIAARLERLRARRGEDKLAVSAQWMGLRAMRGLKSRGIDLTAGEHDQLAQAILKHTGQRTPQSASNVRGVLNTLKNKPDTLGADDTKLKQILSEVRAGIHGAPDQAAPSSVMPSFRGLVRKGVDKLEDVAADTDAIHFLAPTVAGSVIAGNRLNQSESYARTGKPEKRPGLLSRAGTPLMIAGSAGAGGALGSLFGHGAVGTGLGAAYGLATTRPLVNKIDRNIQKGDAKQASSLADRIDDAGIGLLAAPYAADAVSKGLQRSSNAKLRAAGNVIHAAAGTESRFGKSHGRELTGLALVAPGVTHSLEHGIHKVTGKPKVAFVGAVVRPALQAAKGLARGFGGPVSKATTAKRVLGAGATAAGGVGLYGAYKGIQATGDALSGHHAQPIAPPPVPGLQRLF